MKQIFLYFYAAVGKLASSIFYANFLDYSTIRFHQNCGIQTILFSMKKMEFSLLQRLAAYNFYGIINEHFHSFLPHFFCFLPNIEVILAPQSNKIIK